MSFIIIWCEPAPKVTAQGHCSLDCLAIGYSKYNYGEKLVAYSLSLFFIEDFFFLSLQVGLKVECPVTFQQFDREV